MIDQGIEIMTLKAGTIVHVCGWPVELKQDTDVQSHPGNIELIRRDLAVADPTPHRCYRPGCETMTTLGTAWCQACLDEAAKEQQRYPRKPRPKLPTIKRVNAPRSGFRVGSVDKRK